MNLRLTKWINYLLIIIFCFALIYETRYKFIKNKLPKEIPFNVTLITLMVLLTMCIILLLTIMNLMSAKTKTSFFTAFNKISNNFSSMLVDYLIKIEYLKKIYKFFIFKTTKGFLKYYYILHFLNIIPRTILLTFFISDILNEELFYIYKIVYIYIFIYVKNLIITHLNILKINRSEYIKKNWEIRINNFTKIVTIEEFINLQTVYLDSHRTFFDYSLITKKDYIETLKASLNLEKGSRINIKKLHSSTRRVIQLIVDVHLTLYLYHMLEKKDKGILVIIKILYLIGWLYIIAVSLPTLTFTNWEYYILKSFLDNIEPFSGIIL